MQWNGQIVLLHSIRFRDKLHQLLPMTTSSGLWSRSSSAPRNWCSSGNLHLPCVPSRVDERVVRCFSSRFRKVRIFAIPGRHEKLSGVSATGDEVSSMARQRPHLRACSVSSRRHCGKQRADLQPCVSCDTKGSATDGVSLTWRLSGTIQTGF